MSTLPGWRHLVRFALVLVPLTLAPARAQDLPAAPEAGTGRTIHALDLRRPR